MTSFVETADLGRVHDRSEEQTAKSADGSRNRQQVSKRVVMLTAEVALVTDKESRHARALYCELDRDDVDPKRRSACLDHARNGDLARAMRECIIWCLLHV